MVITKYDLQHFSGQNILFLTVMRNNSTITTVLELQSRLLTEEANLRLEK